MFNDTSEKGENRSPLNKNLAYKHAVRLLSHKDYSEHKIKNKLIDKKFLPDEISIAMEAILKR